MRRSASTRLAGALRRWRRQLDQPGRVETRVHRARVILKEARAVLRLFREAMGDSAARDLDQRLRQAMKALAPSRDLLVMSGVLTEMARTHEFPVHRDQWLGALPTITRPKPAALRHVNRLLDELDARLTPVARSCPREFVDDAWWRACRRVQKLQRQSKKDSSPELWHRWRRRVKALAYQIDFVRPPGHPDWAKLRRQAWRLQARLGELQDLHITLDHLPNLDLPRESIKTLRKRLQLAAQQARQHAARARIEKRLLLGPPRPDG